MREDEHWVTARVVDGMGLDEDAPPQVRGLIPMPRRRADHAGSRQQRTSRGWPKPKPFLKKNWGRRMYRVKTPLYSVLQWKVVQKRGLICQNPGSYAKRTSYAQILGHMPKSWVTCQTSKTHTSEDFSRSSLLGTTLKPKFIFARLLPRPRVARMLSGRSYCKNIPLMHPISSRNCWGLKWLTS